MDWTCMLLDHPVCGKTMIQLGIAHDQHFFCPEAIIEDGLRDEVCLTVSRIEGLVQKNLMFFARYITSGLYEPLILPASAATPLFPPRVGHHQSSSFWCKVVRDRFRQKATAKRW